MLSLFLWQNDRINQSSVIFSFKYISLFVPPSTEEFVAQLYSICAARRRAKVVVMEDIQEKFMLTLQNMHQSKTLAPKLKHSNTCSHLSSII